MRHEVTNLQRASRLGWRHQYRLGDNLVADITQPHGPARLQTQGFEALQKVFVGVQFGRCFITTLAQVARLDNEHRHRHIDAGHRDAVEAILGVAGRKQLAGLAARRIEKCQLNRRCAARYAIDDGIAFIADFAARGVHFRRDEGARVEIADPHAGGVAACLDQALLDGKRPDRAKHVAAIRRGIHPALGNHDLHEQVIHIGIRVQ
ncbi:hypothetical protein D3C86_1585150 [compost metagenome]